MTDAYALLLEDTEDDWWSVVVFTDPTWWEWLHAPMPQDGESSWTLARPATLVAAADNDAVTELTSGTFENDKAIDISIATEDTKWNKCEAVDGSQLDAFKYAEKQAAELGATLPKGNVYLGMLY